jgi:hypothetical protein
MGHDPRIAVAVPFVIRHFHRAGMMNGHQLSRGAARQE